MQVIRQSKARQLLCGFIWNLSVYLLFLAFCRNQLTLLQRGQQCLLSLHPPTSTACPRHQWTAAAAVPGGCPGANWCKDWLILAHPAAALTPAPTVAAGVICQTQASRGAKILSSVSECTFASFNLRCLCNRFCLWPVSLYWRPVLRSNGGDHPERSSGSHCREPERSQRLRLRLTMYQTTNSRKTSGAHRSGAPPPGSQRALRAERGSHRPLRGARGRLWEHGAAVRWPLPRPHLPADSGAAAGIWGAVAKNPRTVWCKVCFHSDSETSSETEYWFPRD